MSSISCLQMFSFLPNSVGQFKNSHAITILLPTSTRMSNHILFLLLPSGLLLPDLCLFCSPAKLHQMSCFKDDGLSPHGFRWFCRFFEGLFWWGFFSCLLFGASLLNFYLQIFLCVRYCS